jgi:predicted amidohydrolase
MKICLAQIQAAKGNVKQNIENHKKLITLAISLTADAIFFPELSITGYEPALASGLAVEENDSQFDLFQVMADNHNIVIGIGMPTKFGKGIRISMLLFQPKKVRLTYAKQQLHADELPYFASGTRQTILKVNNQIIAPAICYESLQEDHCANAYDLGATIYISSVAKSKNGLDKAYSHYPKMAKKYGMIVLMVNCIGYCDDFQNTGGSAIWNSDGIIKGSLDGENEGLIIYDTETEAVIEKVL